MKDCDNPYEIEIFGVKCKKQEGSVFEIWESKDPHFNVYLQRENHNKGNKHFWHISLRLSRYPGTQARLYVSSFGYGHSFEEAKRTVEERFKEMFEDIKMISGKIV